MKVLFKGVEMFDEEGRRQVKGEKRKEMDRKGK
jgi:hypothetical protein